MCSKQFIGKSNVRRHLTNVHNIKDKSHFKIKFMPISRGSSFPFIFSKAMVQKTNKTYGTHLVASRNICAGEPIMDTPPFAMIEYVTCLDVLKCFSCGSELKTSNSKIECDHCIDVAFCSKRCSLSKAHKIRCNQMYQKTDCRATRLATEIIRIAVERCKDAKLLLEFSDGISKNKKNVCQPPFFNYGLLLKLKGKNETDHQSIARRATQLVRSLPHFRLITADEDILFNIMLRHVNSQPMNSFSEMEPVSKGGALHRYAIYDILSYFNHSCDPNVSHFIDDNNITHCVTAKEIQEGEQLFIDYLMNESELSSGERRRILEETWHFQCRCRKCIRYTC